jgi:16S rRNA (guanine527-N7)-methyltransferase
MEIDFMRRGCGVLPDILWRFQEEAAEFGVHLGRDQLQMFDIYLAELVEWNRLVRLVSRTDAETVVWSHFMDSLSPCRYLVDGESLLDIGSGAGFPGVPMKIARSAVDLDLVEARRRKANFLRNLVLRLNLERVTVHNRRIEAGESVGRFHTIVSRAMASPQNWVPVALELLHPGGQIILMSSQALDPGKLKDNLTEWGLAVYECFDFELPVVKRARRVLVLR